MSTNYYGQYGGKTRELYAGGIDNLGNAALESNPGEGALIAEPKSTEQVPLARQSMSSVRASAGNNRQAGGPTAVDVGAQVGVMRNLEMSAGGRAHRLSSGPYTKA